MMMIGARLYIYFPYGDMSNDTPKQKQMCYVYIVLFIIFCTRILQLT